MKTVKQYVRSTETGEIRVITNDLKPSKYWRNFTPNHVSIKEKYKKKPFSGTRTQEIAYELSRENIIEYSDTAVEHLKYYMNLVQPNGTFTRNYCSKAQMMLYQSIIGAKLNSYNLGDKKICKKLNKYTSDLIISILEG